MTSGRFSLLVLGVLLSTSCGGPSAAVSSPSARPAAPRGARAAEVAEPRVIHAGGSTLRIVYEGVPLEGSASRIGEWVRRSAQMVVDYCGGTFPVPTLEIQIVVRTYGDVGFGQHFDGRRLRVRIGSDVSEATLLRDWVMVHEMLHTAMPDLSRRHRWMQEGLSTYLESVTRSRAGYIAEKDVWQRWVRQMEHGQPMPGDRGLDRTRTWGRVYWGGALFWMTVDVELRRRSDGRVGLEDAVRGLLARGGNSRADWSTRRVVAVGDEATGLTVLSEMYAAQAQASTAVDLDGLWAELGVRPGPDGDVVLDDRAPLASVRRAIAAPR